MKIKFFLLAMIMLSLSAHSQQQVSVTVTHQIGGPADNSGCALIKLLTSYKLSKSSTEILSISSVGQYIPQDQSATLTNSIPSGAIVITNHIRFEAVHGTVTYEVKSTGNSQLFDPVIQDSHCWCGTNSRSKHLYCYNANGSAMLFNFSAPMSADDCP